ncbi:hypothetical protein I4U23_000034 [Adineta vaga]|nr:hypothetical protein I4U23_000034 [Adineta vaga]
MFVSVMKADLTYTKPLSHSESEKIDMTNQTVEIDSNERIRRCLWYKTVDIWTFYKSMYPHVCTLGDLLHQGLIESNDGPCIGRLVLDQTTPTTEIEWFSYSEIIERSRVIGTHLWSSLNLTPMVSKVATISTNRLEYTCLEHACYMYGFIVVGLHSASDSSTILDVLTRSEASVLIVDNLKRISSMIDDIRKRTNVEKIITIDGEEELNGKIETIPNILKKMGKIVKPSPKIDPNSIAMFLLTSGTTGEITYILAFNVEFRPI